MARLSAELRALLMTELRARERFTIKAIARRNGVSRQTLARLRAEMLQQGSLAADVSQSDPVVKMTQGAH
jgi:DNA-binding IscR family transcriptional regulator